MAVTRILALAALAGLAGCSFIGDTIKSELAAYAEPASGDLAHVRLIGSRNVKVYPNSTCASFTVPGSGYPAGPQMGGQRKRDIGMPEVPGMPDHFGEVAPPAGGPITMSFNFYQESYTPGIPGTGAPGTRSASGCSAARSFVPRVGENYEAIARNRGSWCALSVFRLQQDDAGTWRRMGEISAEAAGCGANAGEAETDTASR